MLAIKRTDNGVAYRFLGTVRNADAEKNDDLMNDALKPVVEKRTLAAWKALNGFALDTIYTDLVARIDMCGLDACEVSVDREGLREELELFFFRTRK
jgi:hypothetical protein